MQTFRYLCNPFTQIHRGVFMTLRRSIYICYFYKHFSLYMCPLSPPLHRKHLHLSCSFSLFHQEYIDGILKQENELEQMNVKEPRTEEEKENAASLLELVTVRKIQFLTTFSNKTIVLHWKCQP